MAKTDKIMQTIFMKVFLLSVVITAARNTYAIDVDHNVSRLPQVKVSDQQQDELKLRSEQWDLARNGEYLVQIPALRTLVNEWSSKNDHIIELRYPGGEEGELWVRELMDWLISLGIPSQYLVSVPGSGEADVIKFQIINTGESYR